MNKVQKREGFTIIEVVLVLAIAGLIFLIVFLAVPALQRSQRDTQRKNDVSRFAAQINSYQANNKGAVPPSAAVADVTSFVSAYLKPTGSSDTFEDPNGGDYTLLAGTGAAPVYVTADSKSQIRYAASGRCGTNGAITAGTARQAAVSVGLEGGGAYCQQN